MDSLIQELEWGQRSSMVEEKKFVINQDTGETIDIKQSDFEFVQMDKKIHDVKFSGKATTFFKDAMKRFVKSKSALGGGIIVCLLILLALLVPTLMPSNGAYNVDRNSAGGNVIERFMQPKLFPSGTGFWDGTIRKTHILFNTETNLPNGYRDGTFTNLITYEETANSANELGHGGYVNVFANDKRNNGNMYSPYHTFNFENDYNLEINFVDEVMTGYVDSDYRVLLQTEEGENYYLTAKDGSYTDELNFKVNINDALENNGYTDILNEPLNARIRFEVESSSEGFAAVLIENLAITTNSKDQEEVDFLTSLGFTEGNEFILRKREDSNFWNTTSGKTAYKVNFTYCDFTYDKYEDVYGVKEYTYEAPNLASLDNDNLIEINMETTGMYATSDREILKERFKIVSDKCPIVEVIEQVGDAEYDPILRQYINYSLKVKVSGYKLYGYSSMPIFLFGTNQYCKDYFKLIFVSLQFSFVLAIGVSAVNIIFGLCWGAISGYFGGWTDIFMERFCEILSGLPATVIITLCIMYGNEWKLGEFSDVIALMVALFMTGWMGVAARTRTQFYRFKGREYVLASRTLGAKDARLIFRHILPNSMGTIITGSILMIPSVIYTEASIAYLGIGLQSQNMFGVILSEANSFYTGENTYLLIIPTIIMAFLLVSFNLFGNGLRDAFNPQLKGSE